MMSAPLSNEELLHYRFTRPKKEAVDFAASESSMLIYLCACCENLKSYYVP
jgi:hypothetical protein